MSLASEYWLYCGLETVEIPEVGFANYKIVSPECYIQDIYVRPGFRNKHVASQLANKITQIAKSKGCKILIGSVVPTYKFADRSRKVLLGYGFKFGKILNGTELYRKDV